jgi:hypothetical protein
LAERRCGHLRGTWGSTSPSPGRRIGTTSPGRGSAWPRDTRFIGGAGGGVSLMRLAPSTAAGSVRSCGQRRAHTDTRTNGRARPRCQCSPPRLALPDCDALCLQMGLGRRRVFSAWPDSISRPRPLARRPCSSCSTCAALGT